MGIGPGSGKGGARRGAGRKPKNPAKGRAQELQVLAQGIIAGLKLSALRYLPDGDDDELLQVTVAGIAADEIARGRGIEIVKLLSSLLQMMGQQNKDVAAANESEESSILMQAITRLPGIEPKPDHATSAAASADDEGECGLDVRAIAELLRAGVGRQGGAIIPGPAGAPASAFGPPQIELFDDLAPGASVTGLPH